MGAVTSHKSQVSQIIIAVVQIRKSPPPPPPALPKVESISFFPHFCRFFPPIMRLLNHVTKVADRQRTGCLLERREICLRLGMWTDILVLL